MLTHTTHSTTWSTSRPTGLKTSFRPSSSRVEPPSVRVHEQMMEAQQHTKVSRRRFLPSKHKKGIFSIACIRSILIVIGKANTVLLPFVFRQTKAPYRRKDDADLSRSTWMIEFESTSMNDIPDSDGRRWNFLSLPQEEFDALSTSNWWSSSCFPNVTRDIWSYIENWIIAKVMSMSC